MALAVDTFGGAIWVIAAATVPQAQDSGVSTETILTVGVGALALLAGAWMAARTAVRNVKSQLAHDRDLREVEGLRVIFDESLSAIEAVRDWILHGQAEGPFADRLFEAAAKRVGDLTLISARLDMRLGESHEVVKDWRALVSAMGKHRQEVEKERADAEKIDPPEGRAPEWGPAVREADDAYEKARKLYIQTARKHLAAQLSGAH